ncbi:LLM class oxidoreductase [Streptomyces europaeiscabiei]|uniref:hypothetical protein n=1 Tax=Streptomyces europaeiscabiei TaxID=146819 RepID=UPI0029C00D5A|nr:hypothetical protein [Streptomyces europaeiscabiei]
MHFADLEATHPGRFLLGLGVSHTKLAEQYRRLYAAMVDPLDALDAAGAPADRRAPAALGPRVLRLSLDRAADSHPYLVTPEHMAEARGTLEGGPLPAPELKVVLETAPATPGPSPVASQVIDDGPGDALPREACRRPAGLLG